MKRDEQQLALAEIEVSNSYVYRVQHPSQTNTISIPEDLRSLYRNCRWKVRCAHPDQLVGERSHVFDRESKYFSASVVES